MGCSARSRRSPPHSTSSGDKAEAESYLSIYKWGPTFLTLNEDPLAEYSPADSEDEVRELEREFFGQFLDGRKA